MKTSLSRVLRKGEWWHFFGTPWGESGPLLRVLEEAERDGGSAPLGWGDVIAHSV